MTDGEGRAPQESWPFFYCTQASTRIPTTKQLCARYAGITDPCMTNLGRTRWLNAAWSRGIALRLPMGCVLAFFLALGTQSACMERYLAHQSYTQRYLLPSKENLVLLALGYREALAGLIWVRGLIYYGEELQHRGAMSDFFRYAEAATKLDAEFRKAYIWGASVGLYRSHGELPVEDIKYAATLLEAGYAHFAPDGLIAWELGSLLAYELAPRLEPGEEKDAVMARASEFLVEASEAGHGPPWLALVSSSNLLNLGKTQRAIDYLKRIYPTLRDPDLQDKVRQRLVSLEAHAEAEALTQSLTLIEARRQATFPYVDLPLFLLLRVSPGDPLPGD